MGAEYNIILILAIHFVADFICQSRDMGHNKGKSLYWLTVHVLTYTAVTGCGWGIFLSTDSVSTFFVTLLMAITFVTHWATDFVTSRVGGYFYLRMLDAKKREHELVENAQPGDEHYNRYNNTKERRWEWFFWMTIGLDQLIHAITLILTYKYLIF